MFLFKLFHLPWEISFLLSWEISNPLLLSVDCLLDSVSHSTTPSRTIAAAYSLKWSLNKIVMTSKNWAYIIMLWSQAKSLTLLVFWELFFGCSRKSLSIPVFWIFYLKTWSAFRIWGWDDFEFEGNFYKWGWLFYNSFTWVVDFYMMEFFLHFLGWGSCASILTSFLDLQGILPLMCNFCQPLSRNCRYIAT